MMLFYRKLRFSSVFFFFCCGDLEHLFTVRAGYGFLETFSDVIDGALTAHTLFLINESMGIIVSKKSIILSAYSWGGIRLYFCAI